MRRYSRHLGRPISTNHETYKTSPLLSQPIIYRNDIFYAFPFFSFSLEPKCASSRFSFDALSYTTHIFQPTRVHHPNKRISSLTQIPFLILVYLTLPLPPYHPRFPSPLAFFLPLLCRRPLLPTKVPKGSLRCSFVHPTKDHELDPFQGVEGAIQRAFRFKTKRSDKKMRIIF